MSYIIRCCNCYFDMYLYEINQKPEIMDPGRQNILSILHIREKEEKKSSKKGLHEQWFHINGEIIFHSCFKCIYKVLQNSTFRKKVLIPPYTSKFGVIYEALEGKCCLENVNPHFDKDKYFTSYFFCYPCQYDLCFHIINDKFNSIDKFYVIK